MPARFVRQAFLFCCAHQLATHAGLNANLGWVVSEQKMTSDQPRCSRGAVKRAPQSLSILWLLPQGPVFYAALG